MAYRIIAFNISNIPTSLVLAILLMIGVAMHAHGDERKSASTLLHEMGYSPEVIETQLAHKRPGVAGIYNKSLYIKQRIEMMQAWADYLDELKAK